MKQLTTRGKRRLHERERQKVFFHFDRIWNWTLNTLFEDNGYTYAQIYRYANLYWQKVCEYYNRKNKEFKAPETLIHDWFRPIEKVK